MNRALGAVRAAATVLLDLLLPRVCVSCGRGLGGASGSASDPPLCASCLAHLELAEPFVLRDLQVHALFRHAGPARDLIHVLKYHGRRDVARFLAARMAENGALLAKLSSDLAPLLVPVPLHGRRERARGYNQSALVAHALAARFPAMVVASLIVRQRSTRSQTTLHRARRAANVAGAFAPLPLGRRAGPRDLATRPVFLVDDVVTTGATLVAAADALSSITRAPIVALVAARADGGGDDVDAKSS